MPKLPLPPHWRDLQRITADLIGHDDVLWRIHRTTGGYPSAWNTMRYYGPLRDMRFDPHPDGPPQVSEEGVLYAAGDIATALAEVYQRTRIIDTITGTPYLTGWRPTRTLRLLDLTLDWPVRAGASHAINYGRKDHTRAWARAIRHRMAGHRRTHPRRRHRPPSHHPVPARSRLLPSLPRHITAHSVTPQRSEPCTQAADRINYRVV